jgi:hypothetical protein
VGSTRDEEFDPSFDLFIQGLALDGTERLHTPLDGGRSKVQSVPLIVHRQRSRLEQHVSAQTTGNQAVEQMA